MRYELTDHEWVAIKPMLTTQGAGVSRATDLPDGLSADLPVQPCYEKFFALPLTQITSTILVIPFPQEGRLAIVTDVGSGMRWTQSVVRILRGRAVLLRTEKSCGPGAPTQALRSRNAPRMTVATKHGHRGEPEGTR